MSKRVIAFLFVCLAFFAVNATAQISVGPNGAGPLTFDTAPTAAEFSTFVLPGPGLIGAGSTYIDVATMDAGVATLDASAIVTPLPTIAEATPGQDAGGMRYNSQLDLIQSRPTTSGTNAAGVMLGKFVNNSGLDRSSAILTYSFGAVNPLAGHLPGFYVYWSLTGAPNSWQPIPELTGTEAVGDHLANISFTAGNWTQGSTLYVVWADDNADGITDPFYTIDNLSVVFTVAEPAITRQPQGTNVVVSRTIRLSVTATGIGLTYAWFKDGAPIDAGANPTAAQSTLIITNAQAIDAGDYRVTVANPGGGVISDIATVVVSDDDDPPLFLFASENPATLRGFRLVLDEPLCTDSLVCETDATLAFNWVIEETENPANLLFVSVVTVNGTNIDFETSNDRDPTKAYRIRGEDVGGTTELGDLFGNRIPVSQSITAAPSRVFIQGVNGYTGTSDAEVHSNASADTPLGTLAVMGADLDDAGFAQSLIRFADIFGSGPGQVPSGSRIASATLSFTQVDAGSVNNLHRLLISFDQSVVTWNSLVDGISADGIEARTQVDATTAGGVGAIDVTASVQAWSDGGDANNGWVILSTGTDGLDLATSESATPPSLSIVYVPVACPNTAPVVTQNPQSKTDIEGATIPLSAGVSNSCNSTFQWQKNGADINTPAARLGPTYTIANAVPGDSGAYRVVVTKTTGGAQATSAAATVTVTNDTVRPVVLRVINTNNTTLVVTFSKIMGASAGVAGNYTQNGVAASAAVLSADGRSVTLTTAARTFPTAYSLRISGVRDNRATPNLILPDPTIVPITTVNVISAWGGAWQYNTNNQDATPTWNSVPTASLDATWLTGNELFGTETSAGVIAIFPTPIATALPPNTNTPPDMVTFYFRKDITLPALPAGASYAINHLIDDGAVFYLDGVEIGRLNMAAAPAPVAYATKATSAGEAVLSSLPFTATAGTHILAVEVHQGGTTTSSDMLFGAQVIAIPTASPSLTISRLGTNSVSVRWTADTKWELINSTTTLTGNYTPVALPAGNPLGFYSTPATGSNHFFRLLYIGP